MDRCGIPPGPAVTALAQRIAASRWLRFGGLQAYQGRAQHQRTPDERRASIARAVALTGETVAALKDASLDCSIVGGAGTGTFGLEAASGVYTELQVGSYVFMDADYARNEEAPPFAQSLFVLTTVMSAPAPRSCGGRRRTQGAGVRQRSSYRVEPARSDLRRGVRRAWEARHR